VIINDVELWVEHPRPIHRTCSKYGFCSANGFQEMKSKVEELSGVSFKLKEFKKHSDPDHCGRRHEPPARKAGSIEAREYDHDR